MDSIHVKYGEETINIYDSLSHSHFAINGISVFRILLSEEGYL